MHETKLVRHPPRPAPVRRGLGIVACVAAIGLATTRALEQHRKRELARALASMPGAANVLPSLRAHSEMILKQFRVGVPANPENRQS